MKTWMQRSLGVAGLAGGLWLAGSLAAYADDTGSHEQDSSTESSIAAPIELGGLSLGIETEDHSSEQQSSSQTDENGDTIETASAQESSSHSELGIDVGEIAVDPAAMLDTESWTSSDEAGDSASTEDSLSSAAEVQAPISVGGVTVTGAQQSESSSEESAATTTDEGTASTTESTSESSATGGALEVGQLDIDPTAALSGDRESAATSTGDEHGVDGAESSSQTAIEASSPISFEGITAAAADERSSERETESSVTNSERTATTSEAVSESSSNAIGVDGLDLALEPAAGLWNSTDSAATQAGGVDGVDASASASDTAIVAGAPFHLGGLTTAGESATTGERHTTSTVADDEGTATSTEHVWDSTRTAFVGQTGDVTGAPWVWTDTRSDASASAGDADRSDSSSVHLIGYAFPFAIGDSGFASEIADASSTQSTGAVTDDSGTRTDERSTENHSVSRPGFVLDGTDGHLHGLLDTENAQRNRLA
ncbi:hypothetical protein EXU48_01470 [Occultella glacieicola]|uniref:Uncharacterized protein n=1 Tax=Occultella glacieicola TaxID=2518684 RepID=A0ABY2EAU3_9MICO|nr:hypothetical protein [Occultella glacieicola]TDE98893.1 hypothetical protein EXU48_01470 [Occultella glacieicola]